MTGAASVIGSALLRRLWVDDTWAGVHFLLGGRDKAALEGLCAEAKALGRGAEPWVLDLEQRGGYGRSLDEARSFGPFQGLALVAGINQDQALPLLTEAAWDKAWAVNLSFHASLLGALKEKKHWCEGAAGLLVGSIVGHRGNAGQAAYAAAKGALLDLLPLAPPALRINLLLPPLVPSPLLDNLSAEARERLFQARSMQDPDPALSCAEAGSFLLGKGASYVHRQVFHADSRVTALGWEE